MNVLRCRLRSFAWIALLAMAALALAPTVSRAAAAPGLGDICSSSGTPALPSGHLDHCPYCSFGSSLGGWPGAVGLRAALTPAQAAPLSPDPADVAGAAHALAQARAPPTARR